MTNNDLISRSALNEVMWDESHDIVLHNEYGKDEACIGLTYNEIENIIENAPAVEMGEDGIDIEKYSDRLYKIAYEKGKAEAERPQGEWSFDSKFLMIGSPYGSYKCSNCGIHTDDKEDNFCWNCGADMRGENEKRE